MNNFQEIMAVLLPITSLLGAIVTILAVIINLINKIGELWSALRPIFKFLFLLVAQILPVGGTIWYFMYFAAIYSERLTEKTFFLLIIIYPTLLISFYEIFWGINLYPKLLSVSKLTELPPNKTKPPAIAAKRTKR